MSGRFWQITRLRFRVWWLKLKRALGLPYKP